MSHLFAAALLAACSAVPASAQLPSLEYNQAAIDSIIKDMTALAEADEVQAADLRSISKDLAELSKDEPAYANPAEAYAYATEQVAASAARLRENIAFIRRETDRDTIIRLVYGALTPRETKRARLKELLDRVDVEIVRLNARSRPTP